MNAFDKFKLTGRPASAAEIAAIVGTEPEEQSPGRLYLGGFYLNEFKDRWLVHLFGEETIGTLEECECLLFAFVERETDEIERIDEAALAALSTEFQAYCTAEGLPQRSADELIHEELSDPQRLWISGFMIRWNAIEEASS